MNTYLLTWNPKVSLGDASWLQQGSENLRAGNKFSGRWRTGNNKGIQVGDRVFLQRQGNRRPGLIGAGTVI